MHQIFWVCLGVGTRKVILPHQVNQRAAAATRKVKEAEAKFQEAQIAAQSAAEKEKVAQAAANRAREEVRATHDKLGRLNQDFERKNQEVMLAEGRVKEAEEKGQQLEREKQEVEAEVKQGKVDIAEGKIILESASSRALFLEGKKFEALLVSLRAGKQLKDLEKLVKPNVTNSVCSKPFRAVGTEVPTTNVCREVVTSLHQAVYGVKEFNSLEGHKNSISSVSFSPDGKTIASGSLDGTVILWDLNLDSLMAKGCRWVGDYLKYNPNVSRDDRGLCEGIVAADG